MGDTMDDAFEGDEEEEETEELVNQVLDEIGININQEVTCLPFHLFFSAEVYELITIMLSNKFWFDMQLLNAPSTAVAAPAAKTKVPQVETAGDDSAIDSDLQARLDNLRKM